MSDPNEAPAAPVDRSQLPADTPSAPPVRGATVPDSATVSGGAFLRFIAFVIDYVGFLGLYAIVWIPVVMTVGADPAALISTGAGGTVLAVAYMTIMEGARGATLGKMVCRLRVTMSDGSPLDWRAAVLRNVFKLVALLFWVLGLVVTLVAMLNSPTAQRTGDRVARTVVVRDVAPATTPVSPTPPVPPTTPPPPPPPAPPTPPRDVP